jgi:3-methyladenine DNA glycosylase AlkD
MENATSILEELEKLGSEQTKKTFSRHGAPDNQFGVKVADLKTIVKRVKKNYQLAIDLYNTGNSDAMYLAGLIGDETKMTKADLNKWAKKSSWYMISEYSVPFVAAESPYGWELAMEWINSNRENVATAGWATLSAWVSVWPDEKLDMKAIGKLLDIIRKDIHNSPNRVRYTMNVFVISVGGYVNELSAKAKEVAKAIGSVKVSMGDTACKVPDALPYIENMEKRNPTRKKKKTARC